MIRISMSVNNALRPLYLGAVAGPTSGLFANYTTKLEVGRIEPHPITMDQLSAIGRDEHNRFPTRTVSSVAGRAGENWPYRSLYSYRPISGLGVPRMEVGLRTTDVVGGGTAIDRTPSASQQLSWLPGDAISTNELLLHKLRFAARNNDEVDYFKWYNKLEKLGRGILLTSVLECIAENSDPAFYMRARLVVWETMGKPKDWTLEKIDSRILNIMLSRGRFEFVQQLIAARPWWR